MTVTKKRTIRQVLTDGDPNQIADMFRRMEFGDLLEPIDETITLAAVSATVDLSAVSASKKTALMVQSVRVTDVTGGSADAGLRLVADASGTPAAKGMALAGVCTLSADGKTLTFEGTVKAIRIVWIPRPKVDVDSDSLVS